MRLKCETIFEAYDSNMELFGIVKKVPKIWFLCINHSTYKFYQKNEINLRFFHFHLIKELARKHTKRPDQSKSQVIAKQVVNEEIPWLLDACETNTFFSLSCSCWFRSLNFIKCSSMAWEAKVYDSFWWSICGHCLLSLVTFSHSALRRATSSSTSSFSFFRTLLSSSKAVALFSALESESSLA